MTDLLAYASIPAPLTNLVGREREIAEIVTLIVRDDVRLLTLTGPGGVGKTRLAMRVADEVGPHFAGVLFVALAPISDPSLLMVTIAQAVGLGESGESTLLERFARAVQGKRLLLLLDNFEQIIAAAPLLVEILRASPDLATIVTSRIRLRVSGEQEYAVPPLGFIPPSPDLDLERAAASEAVRLFDTRARSVNPGLESSADDWRARAEICARVDGLPLAIELAAARVNVLTPPALLARMQRRLPLLVDGPRDVPARLQTMRAAIAWSHDLLSLDQQRVFRRLTVFAGGFGLEAAERVGGWEAGDEGAYHPSPVTLEIVASLVDNSLVGRAVTLNGESRFSMLETIREFGLEQLIESGEERATRDRHAAWCLALVSTVDLWGEQQARHLARLEVEHDNLRSALFWLIARADGHAAQTLAGQLWEFWFMAGHAREGKEWLDRALALENTTSRSRAAALTGAGALAYQAGDLDQAAALVASGSNLFRQLQDHLQLGVTLGLQGNVMMAKEDLARAEDFFRQELAAYQIADNAIAVAVAMLNLGRVAAARGEHERALSLLEQARMQLEAGGAQWELSVACYYLGRAAAGGGDRAFALSCYRDALGLFAVAPDPATVIRCIEGIASVVAAEAPRQAAQLLGAAQAWRARMGRSRQIEEHAPVSEAERHIERLMSAPALATAMTEGRALSLEAAIEAGLAASTSHHDEPGAIDPAAALGLTRREREVLRLLVHGLSDRDIAAALYISPKTVGLHVSHLLGKLGVPSRAAAVAFAHRHHLAKDGDQLPSRD